MANGDGCAAASSDETLASIRTGQPGLTSLSFFFCIAVMFARSVATNCRFHKWAWYVRFVSFFVLFPYPIAVASNDCFTFCFPNCVHYITISDRLLIVGHERCKIALRTIEEGELERTKFQATREPNNFISFSLFILSTSILMANDGNLPYELSISKPRFTSRSNRRKKQIQIHNSKLDFWKCSRDVFDY